MRKYIVLTVVVVAVGVAASLYILPNKEEAAQQHAEIVAGTSAQPALPAPSAVDAAAEYAKGDRSFPIVSAVADQKLAAGDRPGVIALWEDYTKTNPNDAQGHKKLAEQYQLAGRQDDYNKQLELIATAQPTEENLRVLSDVYNANKDYPKQAEVLKKILAINNQNPQNYVDLATIQLVNGDKDGAQKTLDDLKTQHPAYSSYSATRIYITILLEKGKVDDGYKMASDWLNAPFAPATTNTPPSNAPAASTDSTDPRPKELADLCDIFHYAGYPDKAVALVEQHPDMLERSTEVVVAYVNADIAFGRADHAYALLQKIDQANRMTPVLYTIYLDLAIKREDMAAAQGIATKIDVLSFTEEQALNILETSRADNAPSITKILATRFGDPKSLENKPVLTAVIAIIENDKLQDKKIETALNIQLTDIQRTRLAEACVRASKTACFNAIVKQFPPVAQQTPGQVLEYAQLFIIADRPKEVIDAVGMRTKEPNPNNDILTAHHRLSAAAGRDDLLKPWLEQNANTAPMPSIQELYYIANDHHQAVVASDVAERLYARDPSPTNRDILVSSLINSGQNEKAVVLLREQVKNPGANDGLYMSALSKAARYNPSYRKELVDYSSTALKSKRGDNRQQLNYAYALINNGHKNDVIPYAKEYSGERGGDWKRMYGQLTARPGKGGTATAAAAPQLSREQRVEMAKSQSMSEANKRQIAFSLLHDGDKADAAVIFQDVAKDKGPDSQEVKDLLYIWGGKLNKEQLAWVENRAAGANAYDKGRWAELINNTADDNAVMQYVSTTPDALYDRPLRQRYFRILATTGSRQNYDVAMRNWVGQTTDVPALSDYASTAQAYGYREAAANGYARVLTLDPNNAKALNQSAALDYSRGKYTQADLNLTQYLASNQSGTDNNIDTAQAHFYKGELLRRQNNKAGADAEYSQVVKMTSDSGTDAPDALSRMYTSEFRLGQHDAAKEGFNRLLASHPDDKSILADYMSVLIEYHYDSEATRVANQYDKSSPYYNKGAALLGNSAHVASVEQLSNGRELKINFDQPIEGTSPIKMDQAKDLAWLEHSEQGYDSISISAKPGYVVRYTPTSNENFAVVPAAAPQYTPQEEAQRQEDLRLQLLYARIEQDSGQTDKAQQRLDVLKQYYPNNPQLMSYQASLASANGNQGEAVQLLQQAQTVSPDNEDLSLQLRGAQTANREVITNYVKADEAYRGLGKNDEWFTTLSGAVHVNRQAELGFNAQNDFLHTHQTQRESDGRFGNWNQSRQRGEIYGAYSLDSGERVQASLFADDKTLGAGGYLDFKSRIGNLELLAEAHRPYWDFVEAVSNYANRDRVGAKDYVNLTPTLSMGIETSLNNYNVDTTDSVKQTFLGRLSLVQQLQAQTETQPYWGVGYGFDGEYGVGGDKKTRTAFDGSQFDPFPLTDREIHSLTAIYQDDWTPRTHVRLVGGIAYNRYGGSFFPLGDGRVDYDITDQWQIGGRARYAEDTNNTDNHELDAGVDLIYKF